MNVQQWNFIDVDECNYSPSEIDSNSILEIEIEKEPTKWKVCMEHTIDDDESKVLPGIKMLAEG